MERGVTSYFSRRDIATCVRRDTLRTNFTSTGRPLGGAVAREGKTWRVNLNIVTRGQDAAALTDFADLAV